ncbi:MAG: c-type cytochrome domain-containing protein [Pirellulales bacterium]
MSWAPHASTCSAQEQEKDAEAATDEPVSYYRQIRPIFQAHCQGCHQPAKPSGSYVMTSFDELMQGGESEIEAVIAGSADDSNLLFQIEPIDGVAAMPKERDPLPADQLGLIRRWISEGAKDDSPESARVRYDAANPPKYELPPVITSLDYSPDGSLLAVSGFHEVLLHKADGSELVGRLVGMSERIESSIFSPDGTRLAVTGGSPGRMGEVQVWNVAERTLHLSLPVTYDTVYGGSWSPDGTRIAFGCADTTVRAIDAETGEQVLYQGAHDDWPLDTVFSTDGTHLVSVSRDRSMKLIEVETQRFIDNITSITPGALKGGLMSVHRHPSKDELLVGGADGAPKIYQMYRTKTRVIGDDFNLIRKFDTMQGRVFSVEYNADGSRFAAGSSSDGRGSVWVFESESGELVSKHEGEVGPVYAVTFSPDGETVAAGGFDGKVRLIETATGKLRKEFVPFPLASESEVAVKDEASP